MATIYYYGISHSKVTLKASKLLIYQIRVLSIYFKDMFEQSNVFVLLNQSITREHIPFLKGLRYISCLPGLRQFKNRRAEITIFNYFLKQYVLSGKPPDIYSTTQFLHNANLFLCYNLWQIN